MQPRRARLDLSEAQLGQDVELPPEEIFQGRLGMHLSRTGLFSAVPY